MPAEKQQHNPIDELKLRSGEAERRRTVASASIKRSEIAPKTGLLIELM
jgi:hypothetical protein